MSVFTKFDAFSLVTDEGKQYRLDKNLYWDIGVLGSGWTIDIPVGSTFDISVPSYLEWFLSPHHRGILLAAAVHDNLLNRGHDAAFSAAEFRRACVARGVKRPFAWVLFAAVFFWTTIASPQNNVPTS